MRTEIFVRVTRKMLSSFDPAAAAHVTLHALQWPHAHGPVPKGFRTEKEERSTGAASDEEDGGRGAAVSSCSDIEKRAGEVGE
jgi:hypothetical protein